MLCSFANKYLSDMESSRDIVQGVFIRLWEKKDEIDTSQPIKPYLFKSVMNRCLNKIRDEKKMVYYELPDDDRQMVSYLDSSSFMEENELQTRIRNAISALPEKCRNIFKMSRFEEMSYKEIANELNVSVKAVEAQMTKALKLLRQDLIDYFIIIFLLNLGL